MQALCDGAIEEPALRRFEKRLLNDLGYGLELAMTGEGAPVEPDRYYRFAVQSAPQLCVAEAPGAVYGQSLADLQAESFGDARSLRDAKRVLRAAIDACLDGRTLKSREVALALRHSRPDEPARGGAVSGGVLHAGIALGVNIDHVATLRQARRGRYPDPCTRR
jgi:recombinational DNA repair protein (RecF pathway)